MWKKEQLVLENQAYYEAEHEEINNAGQTKCESDLWPSGWGPLTQAFFYLIKMKKNSRLQIG